MWILIYTIGTSWVERNGKEGEGMGLPDCAAASVSAIYGRRGGFSCVSPMLPLSVRELPCLAAFK